MQRETLFTGNELPNQTQYCQRSWPSMQGFIRRIFIKVNFELMRCKIKYILFILAFELKAIIKKDKEMITDSVKDV